MALTNQPYIPLYVRDWLTNNKLKMCSTSAHGLMINIMCVMHKEDEYGTLLLGQKFKHSSDICLDFASYLARLLPFDRGEIYTALKELIEESVLCFDGEKLICNRMVEDAILSRKRAKTGAEGGKITREKFKSFARAKPQANGVANAEYENEYENANVTEDENK
jgi:hypothetical protein